MLFPFPEKPAVLRCGLGTNPVAFTEKTAVAPPEGCEDVFAMYYL